MKKVAVLVSGGLDSFVAYHTAVRDFGKDAVSAVHVNLGQPYAEKEDVAIKESGIECINVDCKILGTLLPNLSKEEWIIPGRNLLLVLLASMQAPTVYLSALGTEMHPFAREHDKSTRFYKDASELITYVMDYKYSSNITIKSPFENMNKTQMVSFALNELGLTKEQLLSTSSCYDDHRRFCGECGTCFKRWIAMSNNGIEEPYENNPWECDYAKKSIEGMRQAVANNDYTHYTLPRVEETREALARVGITL